MFDGDPNLEPNRVEPYNQGIERRLNAGDADRREGLGPNLVGTENHIQGLEYKLHIIGAAVLDTYLSAPPGEDPEGVS
jgi:bacterioferritin (cytochrome b1)